MHDFSAEFLDRYIAAAGDALTSCVGAYAIEEAGINLFEKIEGDTFTILGMPLLPLLNELRDTHGAGL
jgi:septum formation protein